MRLHSHTLLHLVVALFLFPLGSRASDFTMEQVLSSPFPSQLAAARQGSRIAWVFTSKGERNVWVADGPNFAAHQVTHYQGDDGQSIAGLALTPDGKTAVYARGSELNENGRSANPTSNPNPPKQQVWAVEIDGGTPRLLGDMGCEFEGCEDIQISPDGKNAVWAAKHQLWIAPVAGGKDARSCWTFAGTSASRNGRQTAGASPRS